MECACRGASMLNVWPEGEQVLPVSRPGWLGVRAVGLDGPEVMELAFVSEPPGAFELVLDEIVSAGRRSLVMTTDHALQVQVRLSAAHPVRDPASATLRLALIGERAITRTFRLEPPTPHFDAWGGLTGSGCVDAGQTGEYEVTITSNGSADLTIHSFEGRNADPGYSLVVAGQTYVLDGGVAMKPPLVIAPGAVVVAKVLFAATGPEPADVVLEIHSDDPDTAEHDGGQDLAFNFSCGAWYQPPDFGTVRIGESKTLDVVLRPRPDASFFRFGGMSVERADFGGPADDFSIDPGDIPAAGFYREELVVPVTFRPTHAGPYAAVLLFCEDGGCNGTDILAAGSAP